MPHRIQWREQTNMNNQFWFCAIFSCTAIYRPTHTLEHFEYTELGSYEKSKSIIIIKATTVEISNKMKTNPLQFAFGPIKKYMEKPSMAMKTSFSIELLLSVSIIFVSFLSYCLRSSWNVFILLELASFHPETDCERSGKIYHERFCRNSNGNGASIKRHIEHMIIFNDGLVKKNITQTMYFMRIDECWQRKPSLIEDSIHILFYVRFAIRS